VDRCWSFYRISFGHCVVCPSLSFDHCVVCPSLSFGHRRSKDRHTMAKTKRYKRTNNGLQSTTHKTKDRVTRTLRKPGGELICDKQTLIIKTLKLY
jgi:hypothetical protein